MDEYRLLPGFARGGKSTIRFATHIASGAEVVVKFCKDDADHAKEVEALQLLHDPNSRLSRRNIISFSDFFNREEVEEPCTLPIIILERGHKSLQEVAGNSRPFTEAVFKPILSVYSYPMFYSACLYLTLPPPSI
jgi:serine/threonine protein kinase